MKEIWRETSTNGRWGLSVVCAEEVKIDCTIQGTVKHLGKVEGKEVFQLLPSEKAETWVLFGGDIDVLSGGNTIIQLGLQSSRYATICLLSAQAVIESRGYKGRNSRVSCLINGQEKNIPASCLLAMGLIVGQKTESIQVQTPPAIKSGMLAALEAAGLA